ncbi:phage recombination protein Bet [Candidatus Pacearchaeota archaeon]|jgi:phage recombination protein Bet|nr:phage recombination protein Bet [Candidatus Pacearchaeota archaeon]
MAGKSLSPADLAQAVAAYCNANCETFSTSEDGKIRIFAGAPGDGDPIVWLDAGCLQSAPVEFGLDFMEYLPVVAKNGRSSNGQAIVPTKERSSGLGQIKPASGAVRDIQVADLTFEDIKTYICPAANDQEVMIFLKLCQARNLNPFLRDAYLIKYDQTKPAQMVVGKDAFTKKAEDHPKFDGYKAGIIVKNPGSLNGLDYREGTFLLKGEDLLGGWAEVYRSDRKATPYKMAVSMGEYSTGKSNWVSKPATMIRKVALVQALREAFPSEFSGMYDGDEMGIDPEKEVSA